MSNYKYHSTNQFRQVVKNIQVMAKYLGYDPEKNETIIDNTLKAPSLKYIGTTKLHGTNASIICHESGDITFHSKSQLLATLNSSGEFNLNSDNAEFAQSMQRRIVGVISIVNQAVSLSEKLYKEVRYPIKISGEWTGQGIQKGVGISFLPKKSFFIFGIKFGEADQTTKTGWCSVKDIKGISHIELSIYNIMDFPTKEITIDFENPTYSQNYLVEATTNVENQCPVSKQLGITECLVGEGLVWTPEDPDYAWDSGNWFKTKGEKHSVSKVKSVGSVDIDKLNSIKEFVEYAVTENRLEQGLTEVGLDQTKVGQFIGWVNRDVNKEEADTLEGNNLSMKDVGKMISTKARDYYLGKLNEV